MPTVEVNVEKCEEAKPAKKKKLVKKTNPERNREEKINSILDKIHKTNPTVCFSKPINKFKFYALDCNSLRIGNYPKMINRGVLVFNDFQEWYDLAIKNEKSLIGFKPMKGADILYKYAKQWATLSMTAQESFKG